MAKTSDNSQFLPAQAGTIDKYVLPSLEELLEAGVHFGHQSRRWHPKIAPYLYKEQNKIHIFDLIKTHQKLSQAAEFLYQSAKEGKLICFVGTKKQASAIVKKAASDAGAFYMSERWTGGMITNFDHVSNKMRRLKKIEEGLDFGGQYENYTKKERLDLEREVEKLEEEVGGVRNLEKIPDVLFAVDIKRESTAVKEAHDRDLKVVALVDSNCDPTLVDYPIPGNDDASRSIEVITQAMGSAVAAGYKEAGLNFQKREPRKVSPAKVESPTVSVIDSSLEQGVEFTVESVEPEKKKVVDVPKEKLVKKVTKKSVKKEKVVVKAKPAVKKVQKKKVIKEKKVKSNKTKVKKK